MRRSNFWLFVLLSLIVTAWLVTFIYWFPRLPLSKEKRYRQYYEQRFNK